MTVSREWGQSPNAAMFLQNTFYKHMKFWNQARLCLCLAVINFEAHIMLSLMLTVFIHV